MWVLPQPALMLMPSGSVEEHGHLRAGLLERERRGQVHGAVRAVEGDLQPLRSSGMRLTTSHT